MAQYFYINKDATLPTLRVELVNDAKYDFFKQNYFNNGIQNADVTFSMWDENEKLRISNAPCNIILASEGSCEERYIIEYVWKSRDTKEKGQYKGQFKISFNCGLYEDGTTYPSGDLIVPIYEDLYIMVK